MQTERERQTANTVKPKKKKTKSFAPNHQNIYSNKASFTQYLFQIAIENKANLEWIIFPLSVDQKEFHPPWKFRRK